MKRVSFRTRDGRRVSFLARLRARRTKGKRRGQSKYFGSRSYYVKAGKIHRYSLARDRARKSKRTRKKGYARWRGDLKGSRI